MALVDVVVVVVVPSKAVRMEAVQSAWGGATGGATGGEGGGGAKGAVAALVP